jgi:hypothetical protein
VYIEALTVCVGYADFLRETLRYSLPVLDRLLVVTTPRDEETRDLCWRRNVEVLLTDDFYREGRAFDKARAVDRGLQLLAHRDWLLHLDADIVLPPHLRSTLSTADLDPACLYGCDRARVPGWQAWQAFQATGHLHTASRSMHHSVGLPPGLEIGTRWADLHHAWVPIGFFQLWNRQAEMRHGIRQRRYPNHGHNDAARTDVQFALQWDRKHRLLLPELVVLHLESSGAPVGANWAGRTTPRFGPPRHPKPPGKPCS